MYALSTITIGEIKLMDTIFDSSMTYSQAQKVWFDYIDAHRVENILHVANQYMDTLKQIIRRDAIEDQGWLTSYNFGD